MARMRIRDVPTWCRETPALIAWSEDLVRWEFGGEVFPSRAVCIAPKRIDGRFWAYYYGMADNRIGVAAAE